MSKKIKEGVSIILPTFRRIAGLETALDSLMHQTASGLAIEIIIADNDPDASAKNFVMQYSNRSIHKICYIHVPKPGVSNARNAALKAANGRYYAFLDDDQEAGKGWLETLLKISVKYKAALSFVPTHARIPGRSKYDSYLVNFFSRFGPDLDEGVVDNFFGCGNSLLDTRLCKLPSPPFDIAMNETGGEDDVLFSQLQNQGINISWSNQALAYEDILPHRATPKYVKVRSFAFGQGPAQICAESTPPQRLGILKWMCVGAIQWLIYWPLAQLSKVVGHKSYVHYLAKYSQGAGKIFWFGKFKPKLYGAAVVENKVF